MRAKTKEHVERCESATTPASACRCRCGGKCHGRRLVAQSGGREVFEALASDDPHHLQTASERRAVEAEKRERKRIERLNRDRLALIEDVRRRSPEHAAQLEARWFKAA